MQEQKRTRRIRWIMGIFLAGMLGSTPGATNTWVGNVSSNWADPLNWLPTNTVPGASDVALFNNNTTNACVVPAGTTQSVSQLDLKGFSGSGDNRKLIISPGATLHNMTNTTTYMFYFAVGDRGIIEVQSNAVLTSSNANFYIAVGAWARPVQGTMNIIGGRVIMPLVFGFGMGNESTTVSGYTAAVNVSASGFLSCGEIRVATGGWDASQVGRGVLTISNEGSWVQATTFTISEGQTGASVEGNGRGSVIVYGGTLSVGTFYNAHSPVTTSNSTNVAVFTIRGGQLLVSNHMYNTTADRQDEQGTITIASGATNLLVGGNYYQRTNGTLIAEITSASHPPLKVNGTNYLAGTLTVASNSVEQRGRWDIIIGDADNNSGSPGISGRFNTFDTSAMAHPANWILSYTDDKVILSYVPKGTVFSIR